MVDDDVLLLFDLRQSSYTQRSLTPEGRGEAPVAAFGACTLVSSGGRLSAGSDLLGDHGPFNIGPRDCSWDGSTLIYATARY